MPDEARIGEGRKGRFSFPVATIATRAFWRKANQDIPRFFGVYPALSFALVRGSTTGYLISDV